MSNTQLIDYFEQKGIIDKVKGDLIRVDLVKTGANEEKVLLDSNYVTEEDIAKARSELFNIPYIDISNLNIPDSVLAEVDGTLLQRFKAVPFERTGEYVKIAMLNPFDIQAIQALQVNYPPNTKLQVYISTSDGINVHLGRRLGDVISKEVSSAVEDVGDNVAEIDDIESSDIADRNLQDAPVARIVNSILQYAAKTKASDIHIEPLEKKVRIRFRIHGVMNEKLTLPKHLGG